MYDELRVKQQLGYYLGCAKKTTCGIYGISFVIQSPTHSPIDLEAKILLFLDKFYEEYLSTGDQSTFENYKKGAIARVKGTAMGLETEAESLF